MKKAKRIPRQIRKRNFIQLKNAIRKGKRLIVQLKISNLATHDTAFMLNEIEHWRTHWSKVYKLPLKYSKIEFAKTAVDYIRDCVTVQISYVYDPAQSMRK